MSLGSEKASSQARVINLGIEEPLAVHEMITSHTDKKGTITHADDIFVRVSRYEREELMGKPHNIIRHPFMPKCIFKLFWDKIGRDEEMVAYVVNRAKNGNYYWVIAGTLPVEDGYLSIRIKPTSPLLNNVVMGLYEELGKFKTSSELDKGIDYLLNHLREQGFKSYEQFMIHALELELMHRSEQMNYRAGSQGYIDKQIATLLSKTYRNCEALRDLASNINNEFKKLKLISLNMLIQVEEYEDSLGKPVAVIAESLSEWGDEASAILDNFQTKLDSFFKEAQRARLMHGLSFLQGEMTSLFAEGNDTSAEYQEKLNFYTKKNRDEAMSALKELDIVYIDYSRSLSNLESNIIAMSVFRVNSQMEAASLPDSGDKIAAAVNNVKVFIDFLQEEQRKINEESSQVQLNLGKIKQLSVS